MIYVLDAHAVLWYLEDEQNLGERARHIFGDSRARLVVPTISLAEVLWALRKRADLTVWDALLATIREDTRFVIYPLDLEVVAKIPKKSRNARRDDLRNRSSPGRLNR